MTRGGRNLNALGALLIGAALTTLAASAHADSATTAKKPLRLDAFAVDLAGSARTQAERLNIVIENWSSDADRDRLVNALEEKGPDQLLSELRSMKPRAGYISTATSLGWDILYAQQFKQPDGSRKIVFATDRPMSVIERQNGGRSVDYEFILCEIHLPASGRGEGKLATAARVTYDKADRQIEVENYNLEPVRLSNIQVES